MKIKADDQLEKNKPLVLRVFALGKAISPVVDELFRPVFLSIYCLTSPRIWHQNILVVYRKKFRYSMSTAVEK